MVTFPKKAGPRKPRKMTLFRRDRRGGERAVKGEESARSLPKNLCRSEEKRGEDANGGESRPISTGGKEPSDHVLDSLMEKTFLRGRTREGRISRGGRRPGVR